MPWFVALDTAGQVTSFLSNCLPHKNNFLSSGVYNLTESEINSRPIGSFLVIMFIKEGYSVLPVHLNYLRYTLLAL